MESISTEEFIRSRARMNWSRRMVADALEISPYKFRAICKAMPDVEWPITGMSVARRECDAARRGVSTPELREASALARIARYAAARQLTIGEFTGSATQHAKFWGPEMVTVSLHTVRRRLVAGMSDYDALFLPPQASCAKPTRNGYWSKK